MVFGLRSILEMIPKTFSRVLVCALRTSGPDASRHAVLEWAGVWLTGPAAGESPFFRESAGYPGSAFDPRTAEITGISEGRAFSPDYLDEGEAVADFVAWSGADRDPIILAGLRPSMVRAFVAAAWKRSGGPGRPRTLPLVHAHVLDLHSLYVARELAAGRPVPSRGFRPDEMAVGLGLDPVPGSASAVAAVQLAAVMFRRLIVPL